MTDFVVKNRTPEIIISLKRRDGSVYDMTNKTAQIGYRIGDGITKVKDMTVMSPPTDGKIKYIFELVSALYDLYGPGQLYVSVRVFDTVTFKYLSSTEILQFTVRDVIKLP